MTTTEESPGGKVAKKYVCVSTASLLVSARRQRAIRYDGNLKNLSTNERARCSATRNDAVILHFSSFTNDESNISRMHFEKFAHHFITVSKRSSFRSIPPTRDCFLGEDLWKDEFSVRTRVLLFYNLQIFAKRFLLRRFHARAQTHKSSETASKWISDIEMKSVCPATCRISFVNDCFADSATFTAE